MVGNFVKPVASVVKPVVSYFNLFYVSESQLVFCHKHPILHPVRRSGEI